MNRRQFIANSVVGFPLSMRALSRVLAPAETAFLVVGDWGTGGALQRRVANAMATVATASQASFVLSTGDNIYPNGVTSVDDPQWSTKFERIYQQLALPWWAVLGNHDHRGSPDAQIAYSAKNPRWNMPGRNWRKNVVVDGVTNLSILALDTTPIMQGASGWQQQLSWLDASLATEPAAVPVVVGHHPLRSYGHYGDSSVLVKHLKPLLDRHGVRLYLCGHDHDIQLIRHPEDRFACLVSGGGGGERAAHAGKHSLAAYTGGGFALVRSGAGELSVELFDSIGTRKGRFAL